MKSRRYVPRETQIQGAILEALYLDRRVVWVARMNTGAARYVDERGKKRIVKFGFLDARIFWVNFRAASCLR